MTQRISPAGLTLIKEFEQGPGGGPALVAYRCPAGKLTISWGHCGPDVRPGMRITKEEAEDILGKDVAKFERGVDAVVAPATTENEIAALCAFAFNCGLGAFRGSTLLKKHNAGDRAGAAAEFARWNKATGANGTLQELRGLTRRRAAEMALYLTPDPDEEILDPQRTRAADVEARPEGMSRGTVQAMTAGGTLGGGTLVSLATSNPEVVGSVLTTGLQHAPWVVLTVIVLGVVGYLVYRMRR